MFEDFDDDIEDTLPFYFSKDDAKMIFTLGERMIMHDKFDVGHFAYRHRPHYWRGKRETKHMSAFHHWIPGFAMIVVGQILGSVAELHETYKSIAPVKTNTKKDLSYDDLLNIY